MAILALRGSAAVNGVSQLHGAVSRRIFQPLFPGWPIHEVAVEAITNGVHVSSWESEWADALWMKAAGGERWLGTLDGLPEAIQLLSDSELWTFRAKARQTLVNAVRYYLMQQRRRDGAEPDMVQAAQSVLDPHVLTLGFARRFAAYKRPNLLLHDPDRLLRLLTHPERPVQLIVAGKAHPQDETGKHLIRQLVQFTHQSAVSKRAVFLEDYDIELAIWVRAEAAVILEESGGPKFIQGIMFDITERKRAEEQFEQQREALYQHEKVAAMGQLLAGVAHELNNPLAVVSCYAELLRAQIQDGPQAEQMEKISQAAQRCVRIVKSFLTLARQRPPERHEVHLNDVIREVLELMAYPLRVDGVEAGIKLEEELPPIWADPDQLHQVVVHLLSNAHQALRASSRPRRLTVSTCYDPLQSRVFLEVADTGPGIPPELQGRIFEPFFTTKFPGRGTGLGLPLCQGIIEAHGGAIRVQSTPGEETLFILELPITTRPAGVSEVRPDAALTCQQAGTILVVDDEPEVAAVLAEVLTRDGHRVDTAANGTVALRKLQAQSYDLILTDMRMSEVDGPRLYKELVRQHPTLSRRVIFMTGDALTSETQEFLAETAMPFVSKPFDLQEIRHVIQQMLQARMT